MPHVAFVPLSGTRVKAEGVLELGMTLPGLRRRAEALEQLPALALLTLAGMTPEPWACSYHEACGGHEQLVEQILATRPTLVALSALTASIDEAYQLSAMLRRHDVPVVIGGLHATVCPDEAANHCDAVVVGEGEPVWHAVLADAANAALQSVYRSTAPFDLESAPLPRYDLLAGRKPSRWTLQTERGCPFACEFCGASRLLGSFREKPIERIRSELAEITRHARRPWIELADDNTFAGGRDMHELLGTLREADARYFTETDWRIGERPDVLGQLAASGCVQVLVGIESLVFRYPGMGAKQAETGRIIDALTAIQQSGVVVNGCFVVGADGETDASLDRMIRFILDSPLAEVQITLQTPFPGTSLYRKLKRSRRLLEDRGWSYYSLFDVTYRPDLMSVTQLERGFERVLREVFAPVAARRRSDIRRQIWRSNPALRGG